MCLIIFDWQPNKKRILTLVSNRDEFHNRPSADAHYWVDLPHIYGGRDLQKNGTWLAGSTHNRFAAVTNYRSPETEKYSNSRGEIPREFLCSTLKAIDFASQLSDQKYSGYNALFFDGEQLIYCTNRYSVDNATFQHHAETLRPGQYGLSNHLLNSPWHKVNRTKPALSKLDVLTSNQDISRYLLDILQDKKMAADDNLPDTGIKKSLEKLWSPAFISGPNYGTRTSMAVIISKEKTYFQERQYKGDIDIFSEQAASMLHLLS